MYPLKLRIVIVLIAVLTIIAAVWQLQERKMSEQRHATEIANVTSRLEYIASAIQSGINNANNVDEARVLASLGEVALSLAHPRASVSFHNKVTIKFTHGLNTRSPEIMCLNPEGKRMYAGAITAIDENTVILNMVTPSTGSCTAESAH